MVQDALGLGASKVDTAYTAMNKVMERVDEIKVKLVAAVGASAENKDKIQSEIKALQVQLKSFADLGKLLRHQLACRSPPTVAAGNPSAGTHADAEIVSSFSRDASGNVVLSKIKINVQNIKLYDSAATTAETRGITEGLRLATTGAREDTATAGCRRHCRGRPTAIRSRRSPSSASPTRRSPQMIAVADVTLNEIADAATLLGAAKKQIDLQKEFTTSLMDSIDRGVGQLVDADMNKESTRLQALQVQQQLGIQSLQIANGNAQSILSLFQR